MKRLRGIRACLIESRGPSFPVLDILNGQVVTLAEGDSKTYASMNVHAGTGGYDGPLGDLVLISY